MAEPASEPVDAQYHLRQIASLQAELQAVRGEMQDFTYTVSHDLRAHLRHILAYADLVQEDAGDSLNPEVRAHLDTITGAARQMGLLMDGLMELSRLGTVPLQTMPLELGGLVQEVCDALRAGQAQREIELRIAQDFPVVKADAELMRQVLHQVVGNAIKFTKPRAQAVIELGWEPVSKDPAADQPEAVRLFVRDNGVGFNPAMQGKLFKVFQRLHSPRQFEGLGLGLAMTRKIIERHGGSVAAEGAQDQGCCVRLQLQRAR